jgi:fermentation-respiration switch protein FrsA (DUF1100 family)
VAATNVTARLRKSRFRKCVVGLLLAVVVIYVGASAFTSLPDLVRFLPEFWYVRPLPYRLLSHTKFDNLSKMDSIHIPVFIAVGTADDNTIPAMAQALFQRANQPKRLYLSPGAGHANMWEVRAEEVQAELKAFIQTVTIPW